MASWIAVDVGCTTVVAAAAAAGGDARLLEFEGEDGPLGAMTASLLLRSDGSARVGGEPDRALDLDPHLGVRGPLAHLESGSAVLELAGGPVPVVALVGELLARPLRTHVRVAGHAPERAVLAIPSAWPPEGRRARALAAAAALAGLPAITLVPAAVAAAVLTREAESETVFVCDVGGRTTQLSLADLDPAVHRLLATTELAVGADLFDETLYLEVLRLLEERDPDAAQRLEEQHLLTAMVDSAPDAARWAACQADLARAVRRCREALGGASASELVVGPPADVVLEIQRERLGSLLEGEVQLVAAAARAQVDQARAAAPPGSSPPQPVRAVLVGGGAEAPGLREALATELDLPVTVASDPVTAVARGALVVAEQLASESDALRAVRRGPQRPAPLPRTPTRMVLEDVADAVMCGDDIVAVVRHDTHQRVVRTDARGRVGAAHGIAGSEVDALAATPAAILVASPGEAALFAADLRPMAKFARPLLAAAGETNAWVVGASAEGVLRLMTLRVEGRAARSVAEERLGLALGAQPRAGLRGVAARAARSAPPRALWTVDGARLLFALPARGRGGRPAQLLGEAGAEGLGQVATKSDGPPWVAAQAPGAGGAIARLTGGGGAPWRLVLGEAQLASWPAGRRISVVTGAGAPWIVVAREARWEALRLDGADLALVRAGDGAVEHARAVEDGLWLVCESGGERRLVCVTAGGELERLAALNGALEPVGRTGGELLALVGPRGALRTLVVLDF